MTEVETAKRRKLRPTELVSIGGGAGVIEVCLQQPTIYFKNQIQRGAAVSFSPRYWYRGLGINAGSIAPITGIQFAASGVGRNFLQSRKAAAGAGAGSESPALSPAETIAAAGFGGAFSSLVGSPAELVMIQQQKNGSTLGAEFINALRQGPRVFYKGLTATAIREGVYCGGYLGLAPVLRREFEALYGAEGAVPFAASAITAGVVAATGSQWADTIKTIQQADIARAAGGSASASASSGRVYRNFFQTALKVYGERQSIRFFFSGLLPRSVRTIGAVFILNLAGDMLSDMYGRSTNTVFID